MNTEVTAQSEREFFCSLNSLLLKSVPGDFYLWHGACVTGHLNEALGSELLPAQFQTR